MTTHDYTALIDAASVYDVANETPLELADSLSTRLQNRIWMKREDLQPVFSFKLRGAYNKISTLPDAAIAAGVVCSSAGNHAQGVALAAKRRGARAVIVMPVTTPAIKIDAVEALGGEVLLHGDTYDDAYTKARELEVNRQLTFIHPFDDPLVIAGQDTIYGNPFQWPLIYKANSGQIKDADLIFPGQYFYIPKAKGSDRSNAIAHAKNRGAWTIGETEASDLDYLAQ